MNTLTRATIRPVTSKPNLIRRLFAFILRVDQHYRDAQKLRNTEDVYLKDMGITRREANDFFCRQFSEKKYD